MRRATSASSSVAFRVQAPLAFASTTMQAPAAAESGPSVTTKSPTLQRGITPPHRRRRRTRRRREGMGLQLLADAGARTRCRAAWSGAPRRAASTSLSSNAVTRFSNSRARSVCDLKVRSSRCTSRVSPDSGLSSENCALICPCADSTRPTSRDSAESCCRARTRRPPRPLARRLPLEVAVALLQLAHQAAQRAVGAIERELAHDRLALQLRPARPARAGPR